MAVASESSQPDNKPPTLRHRRLVIGANVLVQIVAVLALVVMVNWLASRHYLRFDWTKSGYYKLSEKTKQMVAKLEGACGRGRVPAASPAARNTFRKSSRTCATC